MHPIDSIENHPIRSMKMHHSEKSYPFVKNLSDPKNPFNPVKCFNKSTYPETPNKIRQRNFKHPILTVKSVDFFFSYFSDQKK